MSINKEIIDFYDNYSEDSRLSGLTLEKIRTQHIIERNIGKKPLRILDIGGGTGVYSFWLTKLGHKVHLIDASPKHINQAIEHSERSGILLQEISQGDARYLNYKDNEFDVVLMLGPLYHLTKRDDRIIALSEARRVLKPGGTLFAVIISRFASMMDGFHYNLIKDPDFIQIMNQDLKSGQHRNIEGKNYFTTSYFHSSDEIISEIIESQLILQGLFAIESFADYLPDISQKLMDDTFKEMLLNTLKSIENDRSILGISPHIMAIGKK